MSATSPTLIPTPPKSIKGVRRLNRWPIILGLVALALIVLVIVHMLYDRASTQALENAKRESGEVRGAGSIAREAFAVTPPSRQEHKKEPDQPAARKQEDKPPAQQQSNWTEQQRQQAWANYYQQLAQEQSQQAQLETNAYKAPTNVDLKAGGGGTGGMQVIPGMPVPAGVGGSGGIDGSGQAEKRAFAAQGGDIFGMDEQLAGSVHGPKHDTIMAGTVVHGILLGQMNSDMPGTIVGQVSDSVYDYETGDHLLIPAGSRVVGIYDNAVSNGQERIGVVWQRIIFPDSSSRQIGGMEGADQGGSAGFKDQVNTHFWEKLGNAIIVSLVGAGAQLAQPPPPTNGFYSPWSTGTGAITQQMQQFAQQQAQSGSSVPNSLEVRAGYPFTIVFNKDLALPPYVDHRDAVASGRIGPIFQ